MSISQNYPIINPSLSLDFANTKALDSRITFSRPTDAVYYDGKTVTKAEENLLTYSQEFDNAIWTKANSATITANSTTAPDGTTTADTFTLASNISGAYQTQSVVSGQQYVFSVYAKQNTYAKLAMEQRQSSISTDAIFDISAGTVIFGSGTITDVGNGWYRCSIVQTATDTSDLFILSGDTTAVSGDSIYLWGAQLEARDTVTAYQPTTTQPITNYIPTLLTAPANTARFDHNPVTGESLGLLVEEQRTNLALRSEEFDNASWAKTRASITPNTIVAPDGTLTGDKWVEDTTASNTHTLVQNVTINNATVYSFSFYAKAAERSLIRVNSPSIGVDLWFNLATGLLQIPTLGTGTITPVGNGWYRIVATGTSNTTSGAATIFLSNGTTHIYTGDGYSGIYIWGAQLEAGAFPTSYIKTQASQVTRSADSASMTGTNFSDWYRQDEGTFYLEAQSDAPTVSGGNRFFLDVGASGNAIALLTGLISSGQAGLYVQANSSQQAYIVPASSQLLSSGQKVAGAYQTNSFQTANNGVLGIQDTSGIVPSVAIMYIGRVSTNTTSNYLAGHIKKLSYYPARLTNEQLQALTS